MSISEVVSLIYIILMTFRAINIKLYTTYALPERIYVFAFFAFTVVAYLSSNLEKAIEGVSGHKVMSTTLKWGIALSAFAYGTTTKLAGLFSTLSL